MDPRVMAAATHRVEVEDILEAVEVAIPAAEAAVTPAEVVVTADIAR
jgi:hypothetical protein